MSKIDLDPITSGYNLSKINANFQKVEDELNNKVLYRNSPTGEPNSMSSNLDMNGNKILNVVTGTSPSDLATRGYVDEEIAEERVYVDQQLYLVNSELDTKYDKTGGPVFGDINLNGHKLIGASEVQTSKTSTSILEINGVPVVPGNSVIDPYNGTREALRRSYAEAGYNLVDGSFEAGGTLVNANDVLLHEASGKAYSGVGPFPQTVAAGTSPISGGFSDRSLSYGMVNVKNFGVVGDGVTDDTLAIQSVINSASILGRATYFPVGTYKVTGLTLGANGKLIGESRNKSIIRGNSSNAVVSLNGQYAQVSNLFLRDGSHGVKSVNENAQFSQITNCRISYNRIGIETINAYITLIKDNIINFNRWGIVDGGLGFQVVIRDNVIDNNLGGGGVILRGSTGAIVVGNTIEGNRLEATPGGPSTGFGLWVVGFNQRCVIRDNWLEQNGNQDGCSDIIISRPTETWVDDLVTNCIPVEYQSQFSSGQIITGQVDVDGNFFYATKRAVSIKLTSANYCSVSVHNSTFVGIKNKFNRPVELYGTSNIYIDIDNNNVTNTGDITIDSEMMSGIKGSYVFHAGTVPTFGRVMLDGVDLFTGYMSTSEFSALSGATLDATSRPPSSGTTELKNGALKAHQGINGTRVVTGSGRPRAGSTAWFGTLSVPYKVILLGNGSGAGFTYQGVGGFTFRAANDGAGRYIIQEITPVSAEATLHTGDYSGWVVIPSSGFTASRLSGCTRLVIDDLNVVETQMRSSVPPTSYSFPSTYVWNVGDTVYNNAPAAGGFMGWVCTTAGSPGTWKTFGPITA